MYVRFLYGYYCSFRNGGFPCDVPTCTSLVLRHVVSMIGGLVDHISHTYHRQANLVTMHAQCSAIMYVTVHNFNV